MYRRLLLSSVALAILEPCLGDHTNVDVFTALTTEVATETVYDCNSAAKCEGDISNKTVSNEESSTTASVELEPECEDDFTEESNTENTSDTSAPTVLLPAVHWDQDTSSITNLHPVPAGEPVPLFYSDGGSSDPSVEVLIGSMTPTFNYTTVVLDHSDHVSDVTFHSGAGHLKVQFGSAAAYSAARQTWDEGDLLLITNTRDCGNHDGGERCYFLVATVDFDRRNLSATVTGDSQIFADIVVDATFEWGLWRPTASKTTSWVTPAPTSSPRATCVPPADDEHGFPTACLGDDFDLRLDDALGYGDMSEFEFADYVDAAMPGIGHAGNENFDESGPLSARRIHPRFLRGVIDNIRNNVNNAVNNAVNAVTSVIAPIASTIAAPLQSLPNLLTNAGRVSASYSFAIPSKKKEDCSDNSCSLVSGSSALIRDTKLWGKQLRLWTWDSTKTGRNGKKGAAFKPTASGFSGSLDIYCVDCSAQGSFVVQGKTSFLPGLVELSDGYVQIDMSSKFTLQIGIEAQLQYDSGLLSTSLFRKSLNPISVAGAFDVGPIFDVSADFQLNAVLSGHVLAGGVFELKDTSVRISLKTGRIIDQKNWVPILTPVFKAEGDISARAEVGLPVSLSVGLNAFAGRFQATVGVTDRPSLRATAQVSADLSLNKDRSITSGLKQNDGCKGISVQLGWANEVSATAKLTVIKELFNQKFPIHKIDRDLVQECIRPPAKRSIADIKRQTGPGASDESDLDTILFSDPHIPAEPYNTTDGLEFAALRVYENGEVGAFLFNCADENLYVGTNHDSGYCFSQYQIRDDTALLSGDDDLLHYYGNTMARLGVSRLRTAPPEWIPRSSIYVALTPAVRLEGTEQLGYVAVDVTGHVFYPVVCSYKETARPSKVFIVKDLDDGIKTLKSPSVVYSITSGEVADCWPLGLVHGDSDKGLYTGSLPETPFE